MAYLSTSEKRHGTRRVAQKKPKSPATRTHIDLRTRQVQYLEYIAERDDISISHAMQKVIESAIDKIYVDPPLNAQKIRLHLTVAPKCDTYLKLLASRWGIRKSDVARRLIDDAAARDQTV